MLKYLEVQKNWIKIYYTDSFLQYIAPILNQIRISDKLQIYNQIQESMENNKIDYFKYKCILFYALVFNIALAVFGNNFFTDAYFIFCHICVLYAFLKYLQIMGLFAYVNIRYKQAISSYRARVNAGHKCTKQITHLFILPSFKQPYQLIKQSILVIAKHANSRNYCLSLAMEKHQDGSEEKAKRLVKQFSTIFRYISYTIHELQPGQSKTKTSNINWCARHMVPKLLNNGVNLDTLIITIMDSDSHIPQQYVDQMQRHLEDNYEKRHLYIYQPPQIFARNQYESAFFVRIMDNMMSAMHCGQLYSVMNFTLGVSNYSISYRLLERIDFWDTCLYSKGEDMRISVKAFFKTNGETKTCPIYIPISQTCLATEQGYCADFKARMEQARRHSQDQVQLSYAIVSMLNSPVNFSRKFYIVFTIAEVYLMPTLIPVHFVVFILQALNIAHRSSFDSQGYSVILYNNLNTVVMFGNFLLFSLFKFRAYKQIYGGKKVKLYKQVLNPILQLPLVLLFGFLPMIMASINLLTDNITFTVTKKKSLSSSTTQGQNTVIFQSEQIEENRLMQDLRQQLEGNSVASA